ncbi:hypothetical protein O0L34_g18072 [Tuta absoluta]|nr:hypothetical protein O0L34_g18072 [Tuta absoluta]
MAVNAAANCAAVVKKLFPLLDRVLVRRIDAETRTPGGLMIPARALKKVLQGEVVAVGPGSRGITGDFHPMVLKVGDNVILPEHGGIKVAIENDDKEYTLFRESEILARVEVERIMEDEVPTQ